MIESLRQDWLKQWQASPLLRLGSWAILLIMLLYLLLWLDDQLSLKQLEWRRQTAVLADMRALQQQNYWPALLERLEQQQQQLLAATWIANTPGLAKAAVREFIGNTVADSPALIRLRETEFAEPQPVTASVWEMRGRIIATSEGETVPWAWLAALEGHSQGVALDSLDLRLGRRSGVAMTIEFRVMLSGLDRQQP